MFLQLNSDESQNRQVKPTTSHQITIRKHFLQAENDVYFSYYKTNFAIHEERFYRHIEDSVINSSENHFHLFQRLSRNLKKNNDYKELWTVDLNNFGSCTLSLNKQTGKNVILKHVLDSYSKSLTKSILRDTERMMLIKSNYVERISDRILVENNESVSIWYVFEYNSTIALETIKHLLHKTVLKHNVDTESDFVHLLYTCNSTLDKSKETFPKFMNIIRYISSQLLVGMSYFHERGIIHHELNPSNIRITMNGILKITDLGLSKKFRWLNYDSRTFIEMGIDTEYLRLKSPTKRIRLGGMYYYLEPHVRALYSDNDDLSNEIITANSLGFHVDYFSCAMILFELTFGFTFGDIELYKNYSFYEQFGTYELIFFFSEHYLKVFDQYPNLKLAIEDFNNFQLRNLKSFLVNNENGFMDFIVEGLSSEMSRWSRFCGACNTGQYLNFAILQKEISFFKRIDFNNLSNNVPKDFCNILRDYSKKNTVLSQPLKELCRKSPNLNDINLNTDSSGGKFVQNSTSFCIPELPVNSTSSSVNKLNNSSTKISEKSMKIFHHKPHNPNLQFFNNRNETGDYNENPDHKNDTKRKSLSVSEQSKLLKKELEDKKYCSVLSHEIIQKLENQKKNTKITDNELHSIMKSQLSNDRHIDQILFSPTRMQSEFSIFDLKTSKAMLSNSSNKTFPSNEKNHRNNKIEKHCSMHFKRASANNQNVSSKKIDMQRNQPQRNATSKQDTNTLHLDSNENQTKGISADLPSISEYQLKQYKIYNHYKLPQSCSQPSTPVMKSIQNFEYESLLPKGSEPKILFKDITTSGSTEFGTNAVRTRNEQNTRPLKNTDSNPILDMKYSVYDELKKRQEANNHMNYLETKNRNLSPNSTKCIYFDKSQICGDFSSLDSSILPDNTISNVKGEISMKLMAKHKSRKHNRFSFGNKKSTRKRKINQVNNFNENVVLKRRSLADSNVMSLLANPLEEDKVFVNVDGSKNQKDQLTYQNDLPIIDYCTLFKISKTSFRKPSLYTSNSVVALISQECQTQLDDISLNDPNLTENESHREKSSEKCILEEINLPLQFEPDEKENDKEIVTNFKLLCPESENVTPTITECVDLLNDYETGNSNLTFEEDLRRVYNISKHHCEEAFCCNENEVSLLNDDHFDEINDTSDRTIGNITDHQSNDNLSEIHMPKTENDTTRKSVRFRSPVITDIFDPDYCNFTPGEDLEIKCRGILKENADDDIHHHLNDVDMSFFYRSKVNSFDLEIIDDWQQDETVSVKNYVNQDFDLKTIENHCLVLDVEASIAQVDLTGQDNSLSGKDIFNKNINI